MNNQNEDDQVIDEARRRIVGEKTGKNMKSTECLPECRGKTTGFHRKYCPQFRASCGAEKPASIEDITAENAAMQPPIIAPIIPAPIKLAPGMWVQHDGGIAEVFALRDGVAFGCSATDAALKWLPDGVVVGLYGPDWNLIRPAPKTRDFWVVIINEGDYGVVFNSKQDALEYSKLHTCGLSGVFAIKKVVITEREGL